MSEKGERTRLGGKRSSTLKELKASRPVILELIFA